MPTRMLLNSLSEHYGLPVLEVFEKIERGFLTTNHIIGSSSQKYFLKRWRQDNTAKVLEVGTIEAYFSKRGIPVIVPINTLSGQTFLQTLDGLFSVYPYIQGRHIERWTIEGGSSQSLANGLARIHNLGSWAPLDVSDRFKPWDREKFFTLAEQLEQNILKLHERSEFDETALWALCRQRELLESEQRQFADFSLTSDTLCHGDWTSDNVFFAEDCTISHVFDLEKAEVAPRSVELVRSAMYTFLESGYSNINTERAAHYIGDYAKETNITIDEVRGGIQAWYIKELHSLWIHKEHYLASSTRVDVFLQRKLDMLKFWPGNIESILEQLTQYIKR